MFRPIRKKNNALPLEAAKALLRSSRRGILALHGDHGYPYAIPLNFFYDEKAGTLSFHGAKLGHKIDAIKACDKACFTVVGQERQGEEAWAPYLQSVLVFGRCRLVEEEAKAMALLEALARKYYPRGALVLEEIAAAGRATQIFQMEIDHMTAKEVQEK